MQISMNTTQRHDLLALVLDELIPPGPDGTIPGAGQLGIARSLLSAPADSVPDARSETQRVLDAIVRAGCDFSALDRAGRVAALRLVERQCAAEFAAVVRAAYMHYYSRADMRPHFGVGSHPVHPEGYAVEPEPRRFMEELVAPVRARGPCYRGTRP